MLVLRSTGMVDAPLATVAAVLRDPSTIASACAVERVRVRSGSATGRLLVPGDELDVRIPPHWAAVRLRMRVVQADPDVVRAVLVRGPFPELRCDAVLTEVGGRTRVTEAVHGVSPLGGMGRFADLAVVRKHLKRIQASRIRTVREVSEGWARRRVVVGAALVHKGRLLAQQRRFPAAHAGRWELPGGRVEPGESEVDAVVRECREELDVEVAVNGRGGATSRVGTDVPLDPDSVLRIHQARLVDESTSPRAVEHRQLRWVDETELGALDWLEADRVLVHSLRRLLR